MRIETVDGVKKIYLSVHECLHDDEAERLLGEFIDESSYDVLIQEDADIYKPADVLGNHDLLISFRKKVFPRSLTRAAAEGLRGSIGRSENRGLAAGPRDQTTGLGARDWVLDANGKPTGQIYKRGDGSISDTRYAVPVESGIAGYFDRYVRIPYCRKTSFTRDNPKDWEKSIPFLQAVSEQFRLLHPTKWANQKKIADQTTQDFVIPGTVFTTVTVNRTFRTACHRDAGDYMDGFGNITAFENGKYNKAYLCMPKFRVAVDLREGDIMLFDVHEIHGNMPIELVDKGAERISVVCYYRDKMQECKSKAYEDARFRFVELYRKDAKLAAEKDTLNGIWPGQWHSPEWHNYLVKNGLEEDAKDDFPELYEQKMTISEDFFV